MSTCYCLSNALDRSLPYYIIDIVIIVPALIYKCEIKQVDGQLTMSLSIISLVIRSKAPTNCLIMFFYTINIPLTQGEGGIKYELE